MNEEIVQIILKQKRLEVEIAEIAVRLQEIKIKELL